MVLPLVTANIGKKFANNYQIAVSNLIGFAIIHFHKVFVKVLQKVALISFLLIDYNKLFII